MSDEGGSNVAGAGALAWLEATAASHSRRPAWSFRGRTLSFEALREGVLRRAAAIQSLGMKGGESIGLMLGDSPALVLYQLGALAAGVKPLLLDPSAPAERAGRALKASHARILVSSDGAAAYATATELLAFSIIERVIVAPISSQVSTVSALGLMFGGRDRLARVSATPGGPVVREADWLKDFTPSRQAALPAPEGGSGPVNVDQVLAALPELGRGTERIVAAVPLSNPLMSALMTGIGLKLAAEVTIPDGPDVSDIARALARQAGSVLVTPPARLAQMVSGGGVASHIWRDLKCAVTIGGAPDVERLAGFAAVSGAPLRSIFSAAGAAAAVSGAGQAVPPGGFTPLEGTRFIARDLAERTREVPRGERGALYVAGPQYGDKDTFVPTGDVGVVNASGEVVLIDRIDELVVAAGYMIYPRRIEAALRSHPAVAEAAVVGISDGKRGMAPKAFVIPKRGFAITERDLMAHLAERISRIELPADIDFCSSLPRDGAGEIDRGALKDGAAGAK